MDWAVHICLLHRCDQPADLRQFCFTEGDDRALEQQPGFFARAPAPWPRAGACPLLLHGGDDLVGAPSVDVTAAAVSQSELCAAMHTCGSCNCGGHLQQPSAPPIRWLQPPPPTGPAAPQAADLWIVRGRDPSGYSQKRPQLASSHIKISAQMGHEHAKAR